MRLFNYMSYEHEKIIKNTSVFIDSKTKYVFIESATIDNIKHYEERNQCHYLGTFETFYDIWKTDFKESICFQKTNPFKNQIKNFICTNPYFIWFVKSFETQL